MNGACVPQSPVLSAIERRGVEAVVVDLFGTLVDAPVSQERAAAVTALAACMGVSTQAVDTVFVESWRERHDGRLRVTGEVAAMFVDRCGASMTTADAVSTRLAELASARLRVAPAVVEAVRALRGLGLTVGVLSDASPDVAEAWSTCALAGEVDAAVFSCRAGRTKPDQGLYDEILRRLGVPSRRVLYCGDGGGNELAGAQRQGMRVVRVQRRGGSEALAFGELPWDGPAIRAVEELPELLARGATA